MTRAKQHKTRILALVSQLAGVMALASSPVASGEDPNAAPVIDQGDAPLVVVMSEDNAPIAWEAPQLSASDANEDDWLRWNLSIEPANGSAWVSGNEASPWLFIYKPDSDFHGSDSFEIIVDDRIGGSDTIQIEVSVLPENDAPIFVSPASESEVVAINTGAASDDLEHQTPAIETDGKGNWVIAYGTREYIGSPYYYDSDLFFIHSSDDGNTWSDEALLYSTPELTDVYVSSVAIAAGEAGVWHAIWMVSTGFGTNETYLSRSADGGISWGPAAHVTAALSWNPSNNPHIATDGSGTWLIALESNASLGNTIGSDSDLLFTRSTDNGLTWSPLAPLFNSASDDIANDYEAEIATDGLGTWGIVWSSDAKTQYPTSKDKNILFSRSTDDGTTWSAPVRLSTGGGSDNIDESDCSVATDGMGNWICVWRGEFESHDESSGSLFYSRSTDDGRNWSPVSPLEAYNDNSGFHPLVRTDPSGTWLTAWASRTEVQSNVYDYDFYYGISPDAGGTWPDRFSISPESASDDFRDHGLSLAADATGAWRAVWAGNNNPDDPDGTDFDILYRSFTPSTPLKNPVVLTMEAGDPAPLLSFTLNAMDRDGDALSWSIPVAPAGGLVQVANADNSAGTIEYTQDSGWIGVDHFEVQIDDGNGGIAAIPVYVTPITSPGTVEIHENEPLTVTMSEDAWPIAWNPPSLSVSGVDDLESLVWSLDSPATFGESRVSGMGQYPGTIKYVPPADWSGTDSFVVQVTDGGTVDTRTVNVTVEAVNDAPVTTQPEVLYFDEDSEGVELSLDDLVEDVDNVDAALLWSVAGAEFLQVEIDAASRIASIRAAQDIYGGHTATLKATDPGGRAATVMVPVLIAPLNDAPEAVGAHEVPMGAGLFHDLALDALATDIDNTDEELKWSATEGAFISVEIDPLTRVARLLAAPDAVGTDWLTFTVRDPEGLEDETTVSIEIVPVVEMSVPDDLSAEPGEIFSVTLSIGANSGISRYACSLSYDPGVIEFLSAAPGSLTATWGAPNVSAVDGTVQLESEGGTPVAGAGPLAELNFRVQPGLTNGVTSPLTVGQAEISAEGVVAGPSSGLFSVTKTVFASLPENLSAAAGGQFLLPVLLDDAANLSKYFFEIAYDETLIEFVGVDTGQVTFNWGYPTSDTDSAGRVTIAGAAAQAIGEGAGSLAVLRLRFKISAPLGQSTAIEIATAELNDSTIPASTVGGSAIVAVVDVPSPEVKWVNLNAPGPGNGSATYPYPTLGEGILAVVNRGSVRIHRGDYTETLPWRISKPLRLEAVNGPVRLGEAGAKRLQKSTSNAVVGGTNFIDALNAALSKGSDTEEAIGSVQPATIAATEGEGQKPCLDFELVTREWNTFQADYALTGSDIDGDGLPEAAALALMADVICNAHDSNMRAATQNAYQINLAALRTETHYASLAAYENALASLLAVSTKTLAPIADVLANNGILLQGNYEVAVCDGTALCMPSAVSQTPLEEAYLVFTDAADAVTEPYAGDADLDADGVTNAMEYENVAAHGSSVSEFVAVAQDPHDDGKVQGQE